MVTPPATRKDPVLTPIEFSVEIMSNILSTVVWALSRIVPDVCITTCSFPKTKSLGIPVPECFAQIS